MSTRLFAYGTLRQGGSAPAEIAAAVATLRPLGKGVARGQLYDLGAYPGAVFAGDTLGATDIDGEVYEVPDASTWQQLDAYEGFEPGDLASSLFVRRQIDVRMAEGGGDAVCWAYEYNRATGRTNSGVAHWPDAAR